MKIRSIAERWGDSQEYESLEDLEKDVKESFYPTGDPEVDGGVFEDESFIEGEDYIILEVGEQSAPQGLDVRLCGEELTF